nr:histone deacetylase 14 [Tanacetum cinerariifolium]
MVVLGSAGNRRLDRGGRRVIEKFRDLARWEPIGNSNCYLDLDKSQSNPIYKIAKRQKLHPRPDALLHLPNEELVLGYLKFSAKGTKREVFKMPIPGSLITADIQEASYYQEYLENMVKHRQYMAGETGSDLDSPALKPTKPARKPRLTAPKAPPMPSVSIPVTSAQPAPTSAPAKPQEKKRKQTTKTSDKPSKAKKSKYGFALEERMKSMYDVPWGLLPPVVIKEPKSGKYQPLPEVPGKGKAKVTEDQVAHDLLSLQKPMKKSPADQYIFQRRTSTPTGSSGHDESLYAELEKSDSEEESKKVVIGADEGGQGEGQAGPNPGAQAEGQMGPSAGTQDEGQARSNPEEQSEGQVKPDPGNAGANELSMPSHVVHAGSDREHMGLDDANNDKANAETEVESMVSVTIQQDMSSMPPMTSPIIDLTSRPKSPKVHQQFKAIATETTTTTTITLPPPPDQQQSTAEAMMMKRIGKLEHVMANLIQENKGLEERLYKHGARLYTLEQLDIPHQVSKALYEALEKSMNRDHSQELAQDLAEARKKKKKSRESQKRHLGLHLLYQQDHPELQELLELLDPPKCRHHHLHLHPSIKKVNLQMDKDMALDEQAQSSDDEDIRSAHIPKASALASNYAPPPKDSILVQTGDIAIIMDWFCKRRGITELKPQDLEGPAFEIVKVFHPDVIHLQCQMEECHKLLTDSVDDPILRHNISKPLPLGGPPGQVTIQSDFFFNKDLEYLRYGSKGSRSALSISKMKAAYYPDAGLEQMVPDQFWIEEECKYDIAAMYGISHWWIQRQSFYIDRHTSEGDRSAVRTHMWILSVVRIKVFSMYGYDYMKKIVLHRVDLNEHVIAERDFKYMYPSDFEDLYLLNLQGHLNHLPPLF